MVIFLYNFFHNETKDRTEKGQVSVPADKKNWPDYWKKVSYKEYVNFKEIELPKTDGVFFNTFLTNRTSNGGVLKGETLTLEKLAYMLKCGYGLQDFKKNKEHRTVPSAGSRYPLEIYVFLFSPVETCEAGIYHYNVRNYSLELVSKSSFTKEDIKSFAQSELVESSRCMICITSVFRRTVDKYGSRGYRYILLEAGHVAQNILVAGTEKDVICIPVGGVNDEEIETAMGLQSKEEGLVYALCI